MTRHDYEEFAFAAAFLHEAQAPATIRGMFAYFHPTSKIGDRTVVFPHVYIGPNVVVGDDCVVGPGTCIGQPGFGYEEQEDGSYAYREHHFGVLIGPGVHIGANTCIDQGRHRATVVGRGARIDNNVHIAHNAYIGEHALVIANAMVAGSCVIGRQAIVNPGAMIRDHVKVGERAIVGLGAVVTKNIPPGEVWVGNPARKLRDREEGESTVRHG